MYKKYSKIIVFSITTILCLFSCNSNSDSTFEHHLDSLQVVYYRFSLTDLNVIFEIKTNSDTVYLYKNRPPQELKIPLEHAMIENIKKVITNHLKTEKFLLKRPVIDGGTSVWFDIWVVPDYTNWFAIYSNIKKYEDISLEFKRLIDDLIKEDDQFKEYLDCCG